VNQNPISRLLGVPLEWYHSKGHGDALALVTVSNGKEECAALTFIKKSKNEKTGDKK
jgi:hypothetical protein